MRQYEFISHPSEQWINAVELLRTLEADYLEEACAEVLAPFWRKAYVERWQVTPAGGRRCVQRLLGKRCIRHDPEECRPPGDDHATLWTRNGRPFSYTFEPYGLSFADLAALVRFCDTYGLQARIDTESWYYPGTTLLVEIRTPEMWKVELC